MSEQNPAPRPGPAHMQWNIELPADLEAVYANFVLITHSPSEIVIDFSTILPNAPKARVSTRILMTPMNAKLLHRALGENLEKYEERFGEIKLVQEGFEDQRPLGFKK